MKTRIDVAYAPAHGKRGMLDIHLPDGGRDLPVVMVIHGGALTSLSKERMRNVCTFLVEQGWAAVNVNYRLLPDNPFPAPLADVLGALKWVRETDDADLAAQDRSRIAVLGASAGGYLVAMMGMLLGKEELRSVVDISGPTTRRRTKEMRPGGDERWLKAPVELVHADAPPFLCVHSRRDGVVPLSDSEALVDALNKAGGKAELYGFEGPDELHGIWTEQNAAMPRLLPHLEEKIAEFLRRTL